MKITVLCENTVRKKGLEAEHGLSFYIEAAGKRLLFDMGQTDVFSRNASALGVNLAEIDAAVLSHGHYDHGGGLSRFLHVNSKAPVYLSRFAFGDYFNPAGGYIGLDKTLENSERFIFTGDEARICGGLSLYSCNDCGFDVKAYGMTAARDGVLLPDCFLHEQYLLIDEGGKRVLVSGCSHKGALNLERRFKPDVFIGGLHFMDVRTDGDGFAQLKSAAEALGAYPTRYLTCHCTGIEQYAFLKSVMGGALSYVSTGDTVVL